jgi:Spy/CpxP family protein refolding chaperone
MRTLVAMFTLGLSLALVGNLLAAGQTQPGQHPHHPMGPAAELLKGLDLTDAQKAQVEELVKEYAPKFKAAREEVGTILTPDQKKAYEAAAKAARAEGKKGKQVAEAALAAANLTADEKTKLAEARKEMGPIHKEFHQKLMEILTPAQREQLQKELSQKKA